MDAACIGYGSRPWRDMGRGVLYRRLVVWVGDTGCPHKQRECERLYHAGKGVGSAVLRVSVRSRVCLRGSIVTRNG